MTDRTDSVALAVWVKTPGHSPTKTRLAEAVGRPAAEAFYGCAVEAVREVVERAVALAPGLLAPYWAVAEDAPAAHAHWSGFPVVPQGAGGLGERLATVYDALSARHRGVLFIGADAPQLEPAALRDAARMLAHADFVLGPADDGGFYLFGGRTALPREVWTAVPYSASTTRAELATRLAAHGTIAELAPAFDVDTVDELRRLRETLRERADLGPAGTALRRWLLDHAAAW